MEWFKEESIKKLERFEKLGPDSYMQRKNIQKIEFMDSDTGKSVKYTSDSRIITATEYFRILEVVDNPPSDEVTEKLEENEKNAITLMLAMVDLYEHQQEIDENNKIIMLAIADLYETLEVLFDLIGKGE